VAVPPAATPPHSTYRLQVRAEFDLYAVAGVCEYLAALGVGALYLSPLLPSVRGSAHGYDVVGFDTVDAPRGGLDGWTRLLAAARSRGLGVVVDIVPNHTGVAVPHENPAWWDVLRLGQESPFAHWFDIEWTRGRILLPVLGDDFDPSQLRVDGDELCYFEHRFPIAPGTGTGSGAEVHERQHYELVNFRRADTEQNYRRFFAGTGLAGLRVEDPAVFDATHVEIARWLAHDRVDGIRVDHPDGLADPLGYLRRLRELDGGGEAWLTVEKILEPGEELPSEWPCDGTTGYDALAEVNSLLVDPAAEDRLTRAYRELTGDAWDFHKYVVAGKRSVVDSILRAEVSRLARLAPGVDRAEEALAELLVAFPVYRSYLPTGAEHLAAAIERARAARPELADAIGALSTRLIDPADQLCARFQQTSGAVMAKGVEDTAFYRYNRFVAANEVGGDPGRPGLGVAEFHDAQHKRLARLPRSMTTLSTHDTKRSEDVRARLAVLAEMPEVWTDLAGRLMAAAHLPNPAFAYLIWQTLAGTGFIERERMHAYAEKAMREAGTSTGWIDPDAEFEKAVHAVVDRAYDDPAVHRPLAAFIERITPHGWSNSLAQKLVQLTMPGVPDVYQGSEIWDDSLVDPDNRRPVDFGALRARLDELDAADTPPPVDGTGAAKLWLVSRVLRLRRSRPELFHGYEPVTVRGAAAEHAVAFDRGGAITVATRLPAGLERDGGWRDTAITLPAPATDELTGRAFAGDVPLADLLVRYPVALLAR
jgi:(1->4)-alpha-D-glucan 1-alpha-D-glucosylmutase